MQAELSWPRLENTSKLRYLDSAYLADVFWEMDGVSLSLQGKLVVLPMKK